MLCISVVFEFFFITVKCTSAGAYGKMELDINSLCNALNILVKPADKGVYREKLATVLVPIYTGWKPFAVIRIVCRKTMVCSVAPEVCCFQDA